MGLDPRHITEDKDSNINMAKKGLADFACDHLPV